MTAVPHHFIASTVAVKSNGTVLPHNNLYRFNFYFLYLY